MKNENIETKLKDVETQPKNKSPFYDINGKLKPEYEDRKPGLSSPCVRGMVYDRDGYLTDVD